MPKTKDIESKIMRNQVISEEEEKEIDPETILEDEETEEETDDEPATLDADEIDPFGDKWEQ